MKILRLLNKKIIIFFFLISSVAVSNEPVDIWNIDKKDNKNNVSNTLNNEDQKNSILTDIKNETIISITEEDNLNLEKNYLVGIYDPSDNDLSINMWEFSDGE